MKDYELTVLIHPDLEAQIDDTLEKVRSLITSNGGEIIKEEDAGKKRLAYQIKGQKFANYIFMDVKLPAPALLKISNTLNITEEVIRYLLVKTDLKGREALKEAEAAKSEEPAEEAK